MEPGSDGALVVHGLTPAEVGLLALEHGVALEELGAVARSLEDTFFALTGTAA